MAETLIGESPDENVAVSVDMTPTNQQTCGTGSSAVSFQRSPKDAEEVVDLLLRELIPQEDWDVASNADSDPPVLTEEGLSRISSSAKTDTLEIDMSSHSTHATGKGTDPVKTARGKDVFQALQSQEGNDDVSSVLKDLDRCLGKSSPTEPSVLGTYVTEEDDVDTYSVLSEITAYLSEDDAQHYSSTEEELQLDKGPKESVVTSDVEKTESLVLNGIHEDFDGTTMLVDEELGKDEDALEVCVYTDQEPAVVERCCNEAQDTNQMAVVQKLHSPLSEVQETAPHKAGGTDAGEQTGCLKPSDTGETGIQSQEICTKCSLPKDALSLTKNRQPSHMIKDCVMAVSNKLTNYVNVNDDVIIDLCVTPEEEKDLVDQDCKNLTESLEGDSMETDAQFEVIDVWPNPADSCETPPKSLASSPVVRNQCSSNPDISALCDHKEAKNTSNQSRELNRSETTAIAGLKASAVVNNEKENVGEKGRKAVPTENSIASGSIYCSKEVSFKTPQAQQVTVVAQDKPRNQQSVVCTSQGTRDCSSENSGRSVVHKSSSSKSTRPPSSADCDTKSLQQNKRVKRNPSPEATVKSDTKRPKPKIKPIVWDRSPSHSSKTKNPVVFPAQKTVVFKSEVKQAFVAPTAKNIMVNKVELPKPQKKTAIKKIVWDRSPARQKDTSKKSPIKDGDLEICIPNKPEAVKEDVRLVYDPQRPLSPDSKNKLLEHLLKVEESQETEREEIHPSKLKVTISKLDTKVTVLDTVAESDPDVPCKKLKLVGERGSNTVKSLVAKSKGKTKSVAAKSSSTTGQRKSSRKEKHKTHKSSNRGQEQKERLVVLKGEPKPTVQAHTVAHNSKGKPQHKVDAKEKSTSVEKTLSPDATKRKRTSKRRKKSSDSNDSNDGHGKSRKKVKVSNDIEDELFSLLEVTPIEVKVSRPKLSEKLQLEEKPSLDPRETCIPKDPVHAEGGSEMLETVLGTEVNDLSEKLSRSRARRQQQQKTSETVVGMDPTEVQQVHFLASEVCEEDKSQHDLSEKLSRSRAKRQQQQKTSDTVVGMEPTEVQQLHCLASKVHEEDKSQHDMEDIITDDQTLEEPEQTQEVRIRRQVVITDDHISNIAATKTPIVEEDLDTLDLNLDETGPEIQVTLPGDGSDLKTTFQNMLDEEDFYNENAEALHMENPMEEIIAQERLMYNDTNTTETSTSAALEGEDPVSDNMSGYETVDEVVDSDNEVQVGGSDWQARQAATVSSPSVKASFIIVPCRNQSPAVLKTTESMSSNISVFVKDRKQECQDDSEDMKACESTVVKEAALPGFTGTSDIICNEAAKDGSEFVPEHVGVTHEESEQVPSRIDLEVTVTKDASEGKPTEMDSNDLPQSATSTTVPCDEPVELVCKDNSHNDLNLRELLVLEKALIEALIKSDKNSAGKQSLEVCNVPTALKASHSETSQNQIPTSVKEEETSMQDREQKSDATSAAVSDQSQTSSAKEKDAPCEHISESAGPGVSISNNMVSDDGCKDPVECDAIEKLPPVGNDKIGQLGMSSSSQATTEISPAVVLEVCIGKQGQDAVKPAEHTDTADSAIAKEEQGASEGKPGEDQNTSEPPKSSIVKSDLPAADIRVVQNSCSGEPPAENTGLDTSAQVEDKPKSCTDTTTVFTRLENSPQKKSESGVFNRLGGYSTKLKGKKSRAECCTKPRFHPYQGKTPTESKGQGNENDVHLCKESLEELNQMVTKGDKQAGHKRRKKRKKQRPAGPSRLYNKLQDRLQKEGHDIRETYYLDDVSENPYDEGRFTGRGSDPVYCLEEMPCVRNDDPSDMTSKTYRFKATIRVKFPKRDKDFHCYPAPMLPRFKDIPDKFPRHQMKKKEKK